MKDLFKIYQVDTKDAKDGGSKDEEKGVSIETPAPSEQEFSM